MLYKKLLNVYNIIVEIIQLPIVFLKYFLKDVNPNPNIHLFSMSQQLEGESETSLSAFLLIYT